MSLRIFSFLFLFSFAITNAQKQELSSLLISQELKENANAVVRLDQTDVIISSQRNLNIKNSRIITVLNEKGISSIGAYERYGPNYRIKKIEATIYNAQGTEIKKIKKKDFKDVSLAGGGASVSDDRSIYLDYTPIGYPFTIEYESEIETPNTAFLPNWYPLSGYLVSVQKSIFNVSYTSDLGFRKKEINLVGYEVKKEENIGKLSYEIENIPAVKMEDWSPDFSKIAPRLMIAVSKFHLEGVNGEANNWNEFGEWYYKNLIVGTDELSADTQSKIKNLVGTEKDPKAIAKIIYQYVQEKTRYVSIQLGIGGWKPMLAKDVDRLGYGDCKALTNYTRALLNVVGVPSYYTLVFAGEQNKRNIQSDFVSLQGNHAILALPIENDIIWLECTSQVIPFGFQGTFTDNRDVLVIKPNNSEVVTTKPLIEKTNKQVTKATYSINEKGDINGQVSIETNGSQYDDRYLKERMSNEDRIKYYKKYFNNINNLKIDDLKLVNNKEEVHFNEKIKLSAVSYAEKTGDKLIFIVNAFNFNLGVPQRYRKRYNPFEIQRGFYDVDEVTISLPKDFKLEMLPDNVTVATKYGDYKLEFIKNADGEITYKRELLLKEGYYASSEYNDYRLFREQIARYDNSKIILTKI
ncbi:DUF3857 domain-containing protein [Flavobacterium sp. '19STA2R22 D10 B1']|uniref:DUF3857 domain-containing protein n=1 Tax=Flavobacterium aerium TaxID=3037261 RepID=UPI00278BB6DB|nr:DUF3857 domain-containing protein [Flavobacterium sp. '19STA2R22 D10 B1']